MVLSINQIIVILLQCKPLPKFWDWNLPGECSFRPTTSKVGFLQGGTIARPFLMQRVEANEVSGWGAASDLALAIYP